MSASLPRVRPHSRWWKPLLLRGRDYFSLRRRLDPRPYELARKHCGAKDKWRIISISCNAAQSRGI
ncbi:MAG: replication initiator protein A [Rhodomicrobium sp.]